MKISNMTNLKLWLASLSLALGLTVFGVWFLTSGIMQVAMTFLVDHIVVVIVLFTVPYFTAVIYKILKGIREE